MFDEVSRVVSFLAGVAALVYYLTKGITGLRKLQREKRKVKSKEESNA